MNSYFTPKTPEPRIGALDIVLRAMICVIAVLILGVGIWMTIDSMNRKTTENRTPEQEWSKESDTNAIVHVSATTN